MAKAKGILSNFKRASEIMEEEKSCVCVPVGPNLDHALGGGIPNGSRVMLRTRTGVGKTTLCMNIARNALLQGRRVFFFDVELRLKSKKYFDLEDFDPNDENFFYRSSENGNMLSGEEILTDQINLMMMEENRGALYIIDSLSRLVPKDVLDSDEVSAFRRATLPKLQTDWIAKSGDLIRTSDSIVIGVQHLMIDQGSRPSQYGPALKGKGADGLEYDADIAIESRDKPKNLEGKTQSKENEVFEGLQIKVKIPKNKRSGPVLNEKGITTYLKFGKGVWFEREIIEHLPEMINPEDGTNILKVSGSWFEINTPEIKERIQGKNKLADIISNNVDYFKELHKTHMEDLYDANYDFVGSQK